MLSAGDRREGAQRFLAACESAAPAAAPALGSLAQRLVRELGTPAVVAMADRVAVATAMVLVYDRGSPGAAPVVELRGHAGPIRDLAISGDGWLASASADGSARLWELAAPGAGAALPTGAGTPVQVAFLADGRLLTRVAPPPADAQVVDLKHTVRIWTRDLDALLGAACAVAGRNLGLDEWERLFPGAAYRPTCPQLPVHPDLAVAAVERSIDLLHRGELEAGRAALEAAGRGPALPAARDGLGPPLHRGRGPRARRRGARRVRPGGARPRRRAVPRGAGDRPRWNRRPGGRPRRHRGDSGSRGRRGGPGRGGR